MANRTLILFASAWLLCAGCGPHQEPGPAILARVGTQTVSIEDFTAAWNRRVGLEDTPANRAAVLQVVITRKAMVEAALRAGFDRDPEVRHQYEASLIGHLREAELEPKLRSATVEPVELEQYYHNHSSSHTQHGSLHLAALVLEADPKPTERRAACRQALQTAREKALALPQTEPGFGPLAIQNSQHSASRFAGGDLGWLVPGGKYDDFRRTVVEVGQKLVGKGAVSEVVEDERGVYLVKLIDRRDESATDFALVKDSLSRKLLREKRQALEEAFAEAACQRVGVAVEMARLNALELPAAKSREQPPFAEP